jgi:phosphopantetheinyl transferase
MNTEYPASAHPRFPPGPARPHPASGEIHLWRADLRRPGSESALRQVLARYLGEAAEEIALARGPHGKPALAAGPERLAFNLSHSGDLALVAVSRGRELGVDVERIEPARDLVALAARAFDAEAEAAVRRAPAADRAEVFYELWARHEARLKCLGVGLAGAGGDPGTEPTVRTLSIEPEYAAALAFTGPSPRIRCWMLD